MSTVIDTQHRAPGAELRRMVAVARLHVTNPFPILVLPWLILGFIFLVNLLIWFIVLTAVGGSGLPDSAIEGMQYSGATSFIFVYMLVVAVQAVNLTFPFALGYSVTRRDFYLGSSLTFVALSAYYALGMTILGAIEKATNGWGIGGAMFNVIYLRADNAFLQFVQLFLIFLFFFFVGAATASVYVRWRTNGMIVFFASLTLLLVGVAALITMTGSWPAVGIWFVTNGPLGVAAWLLVPTVLAAITGFFLLRKATPRN